MYTHRRIFNANNTIKNNTIIVIVARVPFRTIQLVPIPITTIPTFVYR